MAFIPYNPDQDISQSLVLNLLELTRITGTVNWYSGFRPQSYNLPTMIDSILQ